MFEGAKNINAQEYQEYLERMKEEEIDPEAMEEALHELAIGEATGYKIPGSENRGTDSVVDKNGEANPDAVRGIDRIEDLNMKRMRESIVELSGVVETMNELLRDMGTDFDDIKKIRILDLKNDEENLRPPFAKVLSVIKNYEYDDYMSICDIADETQKRISALKKILVDLEDLQGSK